MARLVRIAPGLHRVLAFEVYRRLGQDDRGGDHSLPARSGEDESMSGHGLALLCPVNELRIFGAVFRGSFLPEDAALDELRIVLFCLGPDTSSVLSVELEHFRGVALFITPAEVGGALGQDLHHGKSRMLQRLFYIVGDLLVVVCGGPGHKGGT